MNREQLQQAYNHHDVMWKMYGEQADWNAMQQIKSLLTIEAPEKNLGQEQHNSKSADKPHHLKGRPSPLKGRKLSEEHLAKLRKPKTEAQKAALRVPKKNTLKMGKYVRTAEIRQAASAAAKGRSKSEETKQRMSKARRGAKNHNYCEYIFAAAHPVHGMFHGERAQLHKMHPNLPMHELRKLALGDYRSYKGWVLLQPAIVKRQPQHR